MKFRVFCFTVLLLAITNFCAAQSGRKLKVIKVPPPEEPAQNISAKPALPAVSPEPPEYYRCSDSGAPERTSIIDEEKILNPKEVNQRAVVLTRPAPKYTTEARRRNLQGIVVLSVVLTADEKIGAIGVLRPLPAGLTESAVRAACKIRFKPAIKDGKAVTVRLIVEYTFRLGRSSIIAP